MADASTYPTLELRFHSAEHYFPVTKEDMAVFRTVLYDYAPCYINTRQMTYKDVLYDVVLYAFHYAYNGAIGCGYPCFPYAPALGYHEKDIERVAVLLDTLTHEPKHVYFFAHGKGQGSWKPWKACEKNDAGDLVVYVARASHAAYPSRGTRLRIFGLANDACNARGKRLRAKIIGTMERFVAPPQYSITAWNRWMLPFYAKSIRESKPPGCCCSCQ